MVSKEILVQYSSMKEEIDEVREKIDKLEFEIDEIQKKIAKIESGETVKDKVYGGEGGLQPFNIEGVPLKEYDRRKTDLLTKKLMLNQRKSTLEILEFELLRKTNEVEEFISSIEDSNMRRIINLRFLHNMTWVQVARKIGGNTEGSVKMAFQRFMEN